MNNAGAVSEDATGFFLTPAQLEHWTARGGFPG
jgi:hypothetical protein